MLRDDTNDFFPSIFYAISINYNNELSSANIVTAGKNALNSINDRIWKSKLGTWRRMEVIVVNGIWQ